MIDLYEDLEKNTLIDDLWEYELHFISHSDVVRLAEKGFKERLNNMSTADVVAHHKLVINEEG